MRTHPNPRRVGFTHQLRKRELDVLATAKRVGREIRAGAGIVAGIAATNGDAVVIPALRIRDLKLGEGGMIAKILQAIFLLAAKLPAQFELPRFERHAVGLLQSRELGNFGFAFTTRPFRRRHDEISG